MGQMNAETLCLETTAIDQSSYLEQAPRLSLDPKTRILDIALPDLMEHELEQPQWRVESHFIDRPHSVRVFEAGERLRVGIPGPFKSIQVTLMDGEEPLAPEFNFTGISSDAPFIAGTRRRADLYAVTEGNAAPRRGVAPRFGLCACRRRAGRDLRANPRHRHSRGVPLRSLRGSVGRPLRGLAVPRGHACRRPLYLHGRGPAHACKERGPARYRLPLHRCLRQALRVWLPARLAAEEANRTG